MAKALDDSDGFASSELPICQLTREDVELLRAQRPAVSLWRAVVFQVLAALFVAAVSWWVGGHRSSVVYSALYGAACVVVPGALFAYGVARQARVGDAGVAMFGFMLWEFVKIGVAVIMMVAAVKVVSNLSWPAFLVALVVSIKVNWLALLMQGRVKKNVASDKR
ncbi:MAG: ATP synthase subunit I [Burkholderiales bacterium]|nr:ATP synthase subunit I [Burkholderiales bacterium]